MVALVIVVAAVGVDAARAEVVAVEIERREAVAGGRVFGDVGPYEKITGTIRFGFDPENRYNERIVDIDNAPRSTSGGVESVANFFVLRPAAADSIDDAPRIGLLEVSNRGRKASLRYFNGAAPAPGQDPVDDSHFGDGLLMRLGLTVIWVGWQADVPARPELLRLDAPFASGRDGPIEGLVRSDWTVDRPTSTLAIGHRGHVAYPVLDPDRAVLTERSGRLAPRFVVDRSRWRFGREENGTVVEDVTQITMDVGFEAGRIYELVYPARDPRVIGLGLAVVRDVMSFARYDDACPFPVDRGVAFGVSQTGRFLRQFLHQGFNTDEQGRMVFDGMLVHTAGAGRGSFNHRFGQPSRDAHRYSAFFYPTDVFPFTGRVQRDPVTGATDGLLANLYHVGHAPKIFYTNTGYEYWGRAASLIHTTLDGAADVEPAERERIYHIASAQHFPVGFPPRAEARRGPGFRGNPVDLLVTLRALLVGLVEWVGDDAAPPPSTYPRIDAGTLVPLDGVRWPAIPRQRFPRVVHEAYRVDYGPRWRAGIIDNQPPVLGEPFVTLVPQVDPLGNELGGVRGVELEAALATYLPWSLRTGYAGGADELEDFYGTFVPLPATEKERTAVGDPRPSVEATYASKRVYLKAARDAAATLVERRFLLPEDVDRVLERAASTWDWLHGPETATQVEPPNGR